MESSEQEELASFLRLTSSKPIIFQNKWIFVENDLIFSKKFMAYDFIFIKKSNS